MKCGSFGSYSGSGNSAVLLLTDLFISQQFAVTSLTMVTPRMEVCGVTLYNVLHAAKGYILNITVLLYCCRWRLLFGYLNNFSL